MFAQRRMRFCLLAIATCALAACGGAPNGNATPISATNSSRPAAAGTQANPLQEHAATSRYRIDISYPALNADEAPLAAMLHRIAGAAKQDFLRALPDPKIFPEFADRQMTLRIGFKLAARTRAFTSVRESGFQDTGGAHPVPIDAAIVYGVQERRTLPLDDLFTKPDVARKAIADFARAELMKKIMAQTPTAGQGSPAAIKEWSANARQMVEQGSQPTAQNFANYIVRGGGNHGEASPGLTLVFPPYQVAAYVYGTQSVDVPARVFAPCLKPQYRSAFAP